MNEEVAANFANKHEKEIMIRVFCVDSRLFFVFFLSISFAALLSALPFSSVKTYIQIPPFALFCR